MQMIDINSLKGFECEINYPSRVGHLLFCSFTLGEQKRATKSDSPCAFLQKERFFCSLQKEQLRAIRSLQKEQKE